MPFQAAEVIFGSAALAGLGLVAPLVFQPARPEVAECQQVLPECEMPVRMVGPQAERAQQAGDGVLAIVDIGEHE